MKGIIVLLGAPNDDEGSLSSIAMERCRLALGEYSRSGWPILPTGGFGVRFNRTSQPHAFYTRRYLLDQGVPPTGLLPPVLSRFTVEDALLAKPVVHARGAGQLVVVTSDYHAQRAALIFSRVFETLRVTVKASRTTLPRAELEALIEHEEEAISRLRDGTHTSL